MFVRLCQRRCTGNVSSKGPLSALDPSPPAGAAQLREAPRSFPAPRSVTAQVSFALSNRFFQASVILRDRCFIRFASLIFRTAKLRVKLNDINISKNCSMLFTVQLCISKRLWVALMVAFSGAILETTRRTRRSALSCSQVHKQRYFISSHASKDPSTRLSFSN